MRLRRMFVFKFVFKSVFAFIRLCPDKKVRPGRIPGLDMICLLNFK
jgi:hypothetical protein